MKNVTFNNRPLTTVKANSLWVSSLSFDEAFNAYVRLEDVNEAYEKLSVHREVSKEEEELSRLLYLRCKATEYDRVA